MGDAPLMLQPNGVFVEPDVRILVGSFFLGHVLAAYPGESPRVIGHGYRSVDGVEPDGAGNLYATEAFTGKIWQLPPAGRAPILLHRAQSAADCLLDKANHQLIVPDSKAGQLVFISISFDAPIFSTPLHPEIHRRNPLERLSHWHLRRQDDPDCTGPVATSHRSGTCNFLRLIPVISKDQAPARC
jgi:hypothetical protein